MSSDLGPYDLLVKRMKETGLVSSMGNLLSWDQETNMPPKALTFRAEQLAFLSGWEHRRFTAPEVGDWLSACEQKTPVADSVQSANLREWRRRYDRQTKLPPELVEDLERARSLARDAWVDAKHASNFGIFRPHLETILGLTQRMAELWGYQESAYDALLEEYEPGARASALSQLFKELRPAVVDLLHQVGGRAYEGRVLDGDYPVAGQQALNREVAEAFGFDFEAGRIDTTAHPFCSGINPGDCRLTTRYNPRDFTQSLYGVMHEVGHGLYEQGLLSDDFGLPTGMAVSLGIHESQSRLWENHIGRSPSFWEHWYERACYHLPALRRFSPAQITHAVNHVAPSLIRVEADEVTYDLHILLRFEIERELMEGRLSVNEIPAFWNENFEKMFGLKVPDDAHGCLQDIHWSLGSLGYFPTYTLGNLNASQLMWRAEQDCPSLGKDLATGQYKPLLDWLRKNVHQYGQRYRSSELMQRATGLGTQARFHLEYLEKKALAQQSKRTPLPL